MDIVDPHHHLWDLSKLYYPWLSDAANDEWFIGNYRSIRETYLTEDYLNDAGKYRVVKSIHVDAGHDPQQALLETKWLDAEARRSGLPTGIVASVDLSSPDAPAILAKQAEFQLLRGIRQILNRHTNPLYNYVDTDFLESDQWWANYAMLEHHALSFDLQCYAHQLADFIPLASRYPGIPVVLNHTGMPLIGELGGLDAWKKGMRDLARLDHVYVKISGMGMIDRSWSEDSIRDIVLETIDLFGPNRCMFASNFPVDRLFGPFEKHFDAFSHITMGFSVDERHLLFRGAAETVYRI